MTRRDKMKLAAAWIAIVGSLFTGCGMGKWFTTPDQPPEELIEAVIEKYTGADIDLTPDSPEKNECRCLTRDDP